MLQVSRIECNQKAKDEKQPEGRTPTTGVSPFGCVASNLCRRFVVLYAKLSDFTELPTSMNDAEFLRAFERCSLPQSEWTHRAHVRMAWLYLRQEPLSEATPRVCEGIRRYNAAFDKLPAYHETITRGFLILIDARMRQIRGDDSFDEFCARNPDLLDSKLSALLFHYRNETLFSAAARENFLPPDLVPFPL